MQSRLSHPIYCKAYVVIRLLQNWLKELANFDLDCPPSARVLVLMEGGRTWGSTCRKVTEVPTRGTRSLALSFPLLPCCHKGARACLLFFTVMARACLATGPVRGPSNQGQTSETRSNVLFNL